MLHYHDHRLLLCALREAAGRAYAHPTDDTLAGHAILIAASTSVCAAIRTTVACTHAHGERQSPLKSGAVGYVRNGPGRRDGCKSDVPAANTNVLLFAPCFTPRSRLASWSSGHRERRRWRERGQRRIRSGNCRSVWRPAVPSPA